MESSPASYIDHTLLKPTATMADIELICEEAVEYGFASVCIPPVFVPLAAKNLYGSEVSVCTVVGFPCGYNSLRQKVLETTDLVAAGAGEIDMVIQIGHLLAGNLVLVEDEIAQIVIAAKDACVKVIIECCYLTNVQKVQVTEAIVRAGAGFVKTSTGFGPAGATLEDVQLLRQAGGGCVDVKAAGGIRTYDDCSRFVAAGASRIGTSSGVAIMKEWLLLHV